MFKCVQHSNKTKTRQNSPITEYISVSMIGNDNRTKWSPIRSVIILVTDKIRQPRSGSPICQSREWLRIGRQEVQLQINHNCFNFRKQQIHLGQISGRDNF